MAATITAWNDWAVMHRDSTPMHGVPIMLRLARTAIGYGSLEEQLVRLMVWTAATLEHAIEPATGRSPIDFMMQRRGWCDQQCKVFCFIVQHMLEAPTRLVQAKHTDGENSHVMAEVYYDNGWHLFDVDPDHQTAYRDPASGRVMSWEELHANVHVVRDMPHWWRSPKNGEGRAGFFAAKELASYHPLQWSWPWSTKP